MEIYDIDDGEGMKLVRAKNECHALLLYLHETQQSPDALGWIDDPPRVCLAAGPKWRGFNAFRGKGGWPLAKLTVYLRKQDGPILYEDDQHWPGNPAMTRGWL